MNQIERIEKLSDVFGASGFEDDAAEFVRSQLPEYDTVQDHMRNVRCEKDAHSDKPRVMLDSHLDEVGLIVQAIRSDGTMKFLRLGGISPSSLPANSFLIKTDKGTFVPAVVAAKPPHFMSAADRNKPLDPDDMILDCGSTSAQETMALGIHIGSPAVPDVVCRYDQKRDLFFGKAFDCRIGVAAEIETLKRMYQKELPCALSACFSAQEEVGERGVRANAAALKPDVMICFEGCPADDTFSPDYMIQAAIGKGPMLRHMDVSMITNWRFQKFALDTARNLGIPVQESVRSGGGTNGAAVNTQFGVPAIVIGIPVRYIHSSNCFVKYCDYENAVRLACALLERLDKAAVESF